MQGLEKDPKRASRAIQFYLKDRASQVRAPKLISAGCAWPSGKFCIQPGPLTLSPAEVKLKTK